MTKNATLVEQLRRLAQDYNLAGQIGKSEVANVAIGRFSETIKNADVTSARTALEELLSNKSDEGTCSLAAAYLIRSNHPGAIQVLTEISKGDSIIAFEARHCLKRWRAGEIHFGV